MPEPPEFTPSPAAVIAGEQARGLGAGVNAPGYDRADCQRFHDPTLEPRTAPGLAGVVTAQYTVSLGAGIDVVRCARVRGHAVHVKSQRHRLHAAAVVVGQASIGWANDYLDAPRDRVATARRRGFETTVRSSRSWL